MRQARVLALALAVTGMFSAGSCVNNQTTQNGGTASTAHEFFVRAGTGSALVLPLTTRGSRGGVLVVADRPGGTWSPDRVQLLEQLPAHGPATPPPRPP